MAKVLIVDGFWEVREVLVTLFDRYLKDDHQVVTTDTGEKAKELLLEDSPPFDLVMTGNKLSGIKGTELIAWIAENLPNVPTILMSALGEPRGHQADFFLPKPFEAKLLEEAVNALLISQPQKAT